MPVFDLSGREAALKERWRGSIWGQKTTKRPLLRRFWCYVTARFAPRGGKEKPSAVFGLTVKLKDPFIATPSLPFCSCFRSHHLAFFSLDIASANPTPHLLATLLHLYPHATLSLSLSVTQPFIFTQRGGEAFISWLPARPYDGSSSHYQRLISCLFLLRLGQSWHPRLHFSFKTEALLECQSLANCYYFAVVQVSI